MCRTNNIGRCPWLKTCMLPSAIADNLHFMQTAFTPVELQTESATSLASNSAAPTFFFVVVVVVLVVIAPLVLNRNHLSLVQHGLLLLFFFQRLFCQDLQVAVKAESGHVTKDCEPNHQVVRKRRQCMDL
mmetsp:Transcript_134607/g.268678  ORF Transcript_134607/g.268678 Transcript_134607/m.268678 type:complete len:130 (-) Transcript_134607:1264-1653(-)